MARALPVISFVNAILICCYARERNECVFFMVATVAGRRKKKKWNKENRRRLTRAFNFRPGTIVLNVAEIWYRWKRANPVRNVECTNVVRMCGRAPRARVCVFFPIYKGGDVAVRLYASVIFGIKHTGI